MSTIVAVFPLSLVRRACKYKGFVKCSPNNGRGVFTHICTGDSNFYTTLVHAPTGKTWKGV